MAGADHLDPTAPITRAEARAAGLTPGRIRRRFVVLHRGVYLPQGIVPTHRLLALAALKRSPRGAALSHESAAWAWGAAAPTTDLVHVTVMGASRPQARGIVYHRSRRPEDLIDHAGLRLTSPERTFTDLAGGLGVDDLVVLGDSLVARRVTTPELLREAAAIWTGAGALRARRAAALVRVGATEPWQSRLRLMLVAGGLPEPALRLTDPADRRALGAAPLLAYPTARLALRPTEAEPTDVSRPAIEPCRARRGWLVLGIDDPSGAGDPAALVDQVARLLVGRSDTSPVPDGATNRPARSGRRAAVSRPAPNPS